MAEIKWIQAKQEDMKQCKGSSSHDDEVNLWKQRQDRYIRSLESFLIYSILSKVVCLREVSTDVVSLNQQKCIALIMVTSMTDKEECWVLSSYFSQLLLTTTSHNYFSELSRRLSRRDKLILPLFSWSLSETRSLFFFTENHSTQMTSEKVLQRKQHYRREGIWWKREGSGEDSGQTQICCVASNLV